MQTADQLIKQEVLDAIDSAILVVGTDYKVKVCNRHFERFFGVAPTTIVGHDKRDMITHEIKWRVNDPEQFERRLFWLYENPDVVANDEVEVEIPRRIKLHRFSGPVYDEAGELTGRVEVYSDITHAKNLRDELEFKNNQLFFLNAASSAINQTIEIENLGKFFLRRVSHATRARAGVLYVKRNDSFELLATAGNMKRLAMPPPAIDEELPLLPIWGAIKEGIPLRSLADITGSGFFVGFPSLNNDTVNGFCFLVYDKLEKVWLDPLLLKSVGMGLGTGIRNANLYKEAQKTAVLQERDRIAMEMHDGLAQTLSYLGLGIDSLVRRLQENNVNEAYPLLEQLRKVIDMSYKDVREAIIGLRVDIAKEGTFFKSLRKYLQEFQRLTNIKVELLVETQVDTPDLELQMHLIRIIQEALTNVRRHSQATVAKVSFRYDPVKTIIEIEDNGEGFNLEETTKDTIATALHHGIRIMKTRAQSMGGLLHIETTKRAGTRVRLEIPKD